MVKKCKKALEKLVSSEFGIRNEHQLLQADFYQSETGQNVYSANEKSAEGKRERDS